MVRLRPERGKKEETPKEPQLFGDKEVEEQKVNEEPKETIVVEEPKPDGPDEATVRLQKQIEELKKSEEMQRNYAQQMAREREEALRQARNNAVRLEQIQRESQEQEEVAVGAGLAAAKAEADKAQSDYVTALNVGDNAAAAEAQRRMARAEARVDRLELGQQEIEARKKAPKPEERPAHLADRPQINTGDPVDAFNLPDDCKTWLKTHREFMTDQEKVIELDAAHRLAGLKGLVPGNPAYLPFIEGRVFPKQEEPAEPKEPEERPVIVSAPVSREAPTGSGSRPRQVKLTPAQKEAAKMAGITEVEYAKQVLRLDEEKSNGLYGDRRYG